MDPREQSTDRQRRDDTAKIVFCARKKKVSDDLLYKERRSYTTRNHPKNIEGDR